MTVHLHKESEKIRIKRGVRQGDTISPKLFTATLESIFRRLNWENKGVKIDGEFLSNLRFADDIFLCTETPQELQQMLQELSDESRQMGLKMNITKTKVMVVDNTPINVNNVLIENVPGYVYLGQHYSLKEYELFSVCRKMKGGGGVDLYIRNDIHCKLLSVKSFATDDILECVTVELSVIKPMRKTVTISCIYRTPGSNIDMFIESLDKIFTDNKPKTSMFLCWDFNIDLLKYEEHVGSAKFIDTMYSNGLYPLI